MASAQTFRGFREPQSSPEQLYPEKYCRLLNVRSPAFGYRFKAAYTAVIGRLRRTCRRRAADSPGCGRLPVRGSLPKIISHT
jgi:hypothetical protein